MPFTSEKQRRFMWSQHPEIAQRWVNEGAKSTGLPEYAHGGHRTSHKGGSKSILHGMHKQAQSRYRRPSK